MIRRLFRGVAGVLEELVGQPIQFLLAFFISPFPHRYWGRASGAGVFLSCMLQVSLCLAGFMKSYHVFAEQVGANLADTAIEAAKEEGAAKVEALPAMAVGAFTPLAFLAASSSARWLAYGLLSGIVRLLGYASDHPCGHPVLTLADSFVWETLGALKSTALHFASRMSAFWNR